jgi:hypothetical protein
MKLSGIDCSRLSDIKYLETLSIDELVNRAKIIRSIKCQFKKVLINYILLTQKN